MDYIPVIDLATIAQQDYYQIPAEQLHSLAAQFERALRGIGFVYLTNHGITHHKVDNAFKESKTFFELDSEIKHKYLKNLSVGVKGYHGYAPPNKEILSPGVSHELRESFDVDRISNIYPDEPVPGFKPALLKLELECRSLILNLLKILAKALNLADNQYFVDTSRNVVDPNVPSFTSFRCNYYAPIQHPIVSMENDIVRCSPHTDWGILTLLFQDSIGGLEVKTVDGAWVPAKPLEGFILLNTGDMLQFWSGRTFPATFHRVLIPKAELAQRIHRQSIVYFVFPDDDSIISPLVKTLTTFEPLTAYEHTTARIHDAYKY